MPSTYLEKSQNAPLVWHAMSMQSVLLNGRTIGCHFVGLFGVEVNCSVYGTKDSLGLMIWWQLTL